jgi:hypothetical protein
VTDEFDRSTLPDGATLMSDLPRKERKENPTPPLTVGRLKELLESFQDEVVIQTEGCDCVDRAGGIALDDGTLIITRYASHIYD